MSELAVVGAPNEGVWRVGRDPDPASASKSVRTSRLAKPNTGNRFDSPTGSYGVRYFSTSLEGCFGEVLARFRADPKLVDVIGDEWRQLGFMDVGDVPADWRQRRTAINARFPAEGANQRYPRGVQFLDIESIETREALREDFAPLLAYYGYADLDVALVRGQDRRVTRYISQWAYEATDDEDRPLYAGIRYLSRLSSDWECWAAFDNVGVEVTSRRPILPDDAAFKKICALYGLTPY